MTDEYSYKIFKNGKEIDGESITREIAKAMMLEFYAYEKDVDEILNKAE